MKLVKPFVKSCYSEVLASGSSTDNEREDGSLINPEKDHGTTKEISYHGGLGLKYKFPGDPKKCVFWSSSTRAAIHPSLPLTDFARPPRSNYGPNISKVRFSPPDPAPF